MKEDFLIKKGRSIDINILDDDKDLKNACNTFLENIEKEYNHYIKKIKEPKKEKEQKLKPNKPKKPSMNELLIKFMNDTNEKFDS